MPAIERIGDENTGGGVVLSTPHSLVSANNKLVSVDGSPVSGHGRGRHRSPVTSSGSSNVSINNIPVNRLGDPDTCGHTRAEGSPNVSVN